MKRMMLLALATAGLLASCSKDTDEMPGGKVAAEFSQATITRATATAWEAGDAIGVYMVAHGGALTDAAAANIKHTVDTAGAIGTFTPEAGKRIYFPLDGSAVDFHAYYPHQAAMVGGIYKVDVSDQSTHSKIDLLTAKAAGKTKASPNVAFQFAHRLSKLSITIAAGDGLKAADLTGVTVKITGLPTTANYDIALGEASDIGTPTNITARMTGTDGLTAEAILIPQAVVTANRVQVVFTLTNGKEFGWKLTATELAGGSNYTYDLKLNRTGVTVTSSNVSEWTSEGDEAVTSVATFKASDLKMGDYYYSDGTCSDGGLRKIYPDGTYEIDNVQPAPPTGTTCLGIVMKVGKDDSGDWVDDCVYKLKDGTTAMPAIHGYVLALKDANDGNTYAWGSIGTEVGTSQQGTTGFYGYKDTQKIKARGDFGSSNFPAAYHAGTGYELSYASPANSSGWFLPSGGQCKYWLNNRDLLLTQFKKASGDSNYAWKNHYWSSSERDRTPSNYAWSLYFSSGLGLGDVSDYDKDTGYSVRPCLAF